MFPHRRPERVRFVEVDADDAEVAGRTFADLVAARGGHPSDVFADFVLANDSSRASSRRPRERRHRRRPPHPRRPEVLISSSDAGAHVQMLCASGDTTLLLTRHVRDGVTSRSSARCTSSPAARPRRSGSTDRGVIADGNAADLVVFALDELHWDDDEFVADMPGGAKRFRRPEGGYRATVVDGVPVQQVGDLTARSPGRVISSLG